MSKIYTTENLDEVEKMATDLMIAFFKEDYERSRIVGDRDFSRLGVRLEAEPNEDEKTLNLSLSVTSGYNFLGELPVVFACEFYDFLYKEKACIAKFFEKLKQNVNNKPLNEILTVIVRINFISRKTYGEQLIIGMNDIEKFQHLPLSQVRHIGIFNTVQALNLHYDLSGHLNNVNALFLQYWRLCEQLKPVEIRVSDLSIWMKFAQKLKGELSREEIERPFVRLFNECTDDGYKRKVCLHLLAAFDDAKDEVLSKYIHQRILAEKDEPVEVSKKVDLNQFESFLFNEKFFEGCNLSFASGNVVSLYGSNERGLRAVLFSQIMSFVANKKISEFSGVEGYSMFSYPGNGIGFFLSTVDGYNRAIFEAIVKEAINLIVSETNKTPLKALSELDKFNINDYYDMLMARINRVLIGKVIMGAANKHSVCDVVEMGEDIDTKNFKL